MENIVIWVCFIGIVIYLLFGLFEKIQNKKNNVYPFDK